MTDDKGPMTDPRTTEEVLRDAPKDPGSTTKVRDEPGGEGGGVKPDQEDA